MKSETLKSPVICPPPPSLDSYRPREVVWVEAEDVSTRLKVLGLTPKHYENLAHNQAAQKRAFRQAIAQRDHWRDCVERLKRAPPAPTEKRPWWKLWG
jgi:hypothetical protein